MIVWSDNTGDETMDLYPIALGGTFDVECDQTEEFKYSEIAVIDSNRSIVENFTTD